MKRQLLFAAFALLTCLSLYAQNPDEKEIRRLELLEITTVQRGDTAALLNIWAKEFVVNNPYGQIVTIPQIFGFIRAGQIDYSTVERRIDKVTFIDSIAVSMGVETVTPQRNTNNAGKVVKRQYTNIWMRRNNSWRMVARQATIIAAE